MQRSRPRLEETLAARFAVGTARKITVEVLPALLEKARRACGAGITQTIRIGLQLVAASRTYARLRLVVVRTDDGVLGKIHRRRD